MPEFTITISTNEESFRFLRNHGYRLCCFRRFTSSAAGILPLLWQSREISEPEMEFAFGNKNFAAFVSTQMALPGIPIRLSKKSRPFPPSPEDDISHSSIPAELGCRTTIDVFGNLSTRREPGLDGMELFQQAATPFSAGFAQFPEGASDGEFLLPFCIRPVLFDENFRVLPLAEVLLTFSNQYAYQSSVHIPKLCNQGLLVSCASGKNRPVNYDLTTGWSANSKPWAQTIPSESDLRQVLIVPSPV